MKIKCPFCDFVEESDPHNLALHFHMEHGFKALQFFAEKLFKIHETIEKLENPKDPYDARLGDNDKIIVLKSLLENDKK